MTRYLGVATDDMSSAALREQLLNNSIESSGAARVGYDGETVESALDKAKAFPDYSFLRAYTGLAEVIHITNPGIEGYFVETGAVSPVDDGGSMIVDAAGRAWVRVFYGDISVDWFGAVGDGVTDNLAPFTAAALFAASLQNGTNRSPVIKLGNKPYFLSAATPPATWWLPPGGDVNGLPGVAPSFQTDTTRLTGSVFRFSGIDQYSTIYVGDPAYTNQKKTGRVLASQLMGASNRAAGGVAGFTYSTGRNGADQSCIGIAGQAYNDNTATPKTVWGGYVEGIRALAGTGNAFGIESSTFNYAASVLSNPYQQPGETTGVTYAYWASALGDFDSTAALGIITAGKKFNRGIVFYNNALASNEAVVMPFGYKMGWHLSSTSGMASYVQSDILQQYSVNGPCYTRGVRGGNTTANNDLVKFDSWSGNNAGAEVVLADSRLYQVSNFSGGFAGSRWDWSVRNGAGATTRIYLSATAHRPETTNAVSSGEQGSSWSAVWATQVRPGAGNVIWTSGAGTPEGAVTAVVGSMYTRTDGGAGTTLYVKESGAGNTGWVPK